MRNKENFLSDINKTVKTDILDVVDFVQDAAHTLNNDTDNHGEYTVMSDFTTSGVNETFKFSRMARPETDGPGDIEDWFYEGKSV